MDERYSAYLTALGELACAQTIQSAEQEITAGSSGMIDAAITRYGETEILKTWKSVVSEMRMRQLAHSRVETNGRVSLVGQIFELDCSVDLLQEEYKQMRFLYDRHIGFLPESAEAIGQNEGTDEAFEHSCSEYDDAELACAKALTVFSYMCDAVNKTV